MDEERIKKLVRELIVEIGEDPTREGLTKTPERVADSCKEIFSGMILILNYQYNFQKTRRS